jgi:hypothetical protein
MFPGPPDTQQMRSARASGDCRGTFSRFLPASPSLKGQMRLLRTEDNNEPIEIGEPWSAAGSCGRDRSRCVVGCLLSIAIPFQRR